MDHVGSRVRWVTVPLLPQRKAKDEGTAVAEAALDHDSAAVALHHLADRRESKARYRLR